MLKKKILVIEDDSHIRQYLVSLLQDHGYDVYEAGDVQEGLAQTEKHRPDLITLDIEMPGDWGPRFYHHLAKIPKLKKTPVIVISGLPGHQCAVMNAAASLSKPFDRDELLDIIQHTIG
jgi:CheY-like chemotaxis protein